MASHDVEKNGLHAITPQQALGNNGVLPASYGQAVRPSRIGNPGALGLFSFASTTFMLSLYNLQTRGIHTPNVVVGMAIFCGGLAQLLAGMWEFPRGNVFGGTAFTSYGAFWLAYATILIPGSGIVASYAGNEDELASALGIFLVAWMMVTFFLLVAALRKNVGFIVLFAFLTITFALLAAGEFSGKVSATKAGGAFGVATAFIAYYVGLSELLASEDMTVVSLPLGIFPKRVD
ncbi:Accumulation of dyads protein 2 [Psilocybe cubensis]|uniref:Accumulation of dyads protein 2 n=2 Tax=Psilocybe cubensis TaxID=181762 RepID=A0ACB8GJH8_PSICU|nr:Accumulation of dyads protein 2 [Psilocybe cubensis]KAH9475870.1 Accumulation of dyads protein 2 [Psilocybe cubensis]